MIAKLIISRAANEIKGGPAEIVDDGIQTADYTKSGRYSGYV